MSGEAKVNGGVMLSIQISTWWCNLKNESKITTMFPTFTFILVFLCGMSFTLLVSVIPSEWISYVGLGFQQTSSSVSTQLKRLPGGDPSFGVHDYPMTVKERPLIVRPDIKGEALASLHQAIDAKLHGKKNHGDIKGEALASLHQAIDAKLHGKKNKAHKLFQHALALDPNHADALNEYGEFIEATDQDLVKAEHLYTCALLLEPTHNRALVNRKRTHPLVEEIDQGNFMRIDRKRDELFRIPDNNAALRRAKMEMYYQHIYHTNAIEGNTLTLAQTRAILETGIAVSGKSIMEHNEVLGLDAAMKFINSSLVHRIGSITVQDILDIHHRVLGNVDPLEAGRFRRTQVFVGSHVPAPPDQVEDLVSDFSEWLNSEDNQELHPIEFAALVHYKLVYIHPFIDGNGRTSRLLMNLILMQAGFPPVTIKHELRHEYYEYLEKANQGDLRPFIRFIARCTEKTLDEYLWTSRETQVVSLRHNNRHYNDGKTIIVEEN